MVTLKPMNLFFTVNLQTALIKAQKPKLLSLKKNISFQHHYDTTAGLIFRHCTF